MTDALRHRGPDDEGYLVVAGASRRATEHGGADSKRPLPPISSVVGPAAVLLGHRRLAVLDLSPAGHQPMANRSRDRWIVYNGEVYNFPALRRELEAAGHRFASDTDSEVVLAAFDEWGASCLDRFDGMWAFVVLDLRRGVLFGARDRFGVKPLYLAVKGDAFAFASEAKALLELPWLERTLNHEAAFDLLVLGEAGWTDESLLAGVVELAPAEAFELDLDAWTLRRWTYYQLPVLDSRQPVSQAEMRRHVAGVRELLRESVRERLRSDVPLGSCLSGGIDSSAIVCVASELEPSPGRMAFTASFAEPEADERRWAELAARAAGVAWHEVCPQPEELLRDLDELARCQDFPFVSPGVYAQHRVMRLAREHGVTVLLDGQGGDELFTGYAPFHDLQLFSLLRGLDLAGFAREWACSDNAPLGRAGTTRALLRRLGRALAPSPLVDAYRSRRRGPFAVFGQAFWEGHSERWELVREVRELGSLNATLGEMFSRRKLAQLLRYEDRNSMWHSIEARTPFVDDRELVEYVFAVPGSFKIHRGWSKYLLREAMRGTIPEETRLRRDKLGFATPARRWMDRLWPQLASEILPRLDGFLDRDALGGDLWRALSAHGGFGTDLMWRIASFAIWRRVFAV